MPLTRAARRLLDEQWKDAGDPRSPRAKTGGPWWQSEHRFRQVMTKACQRAGIGHLSPHDLRHTFGHRYLVRGGDIYDLSKIHGHASVAVTEKHYGYLRRQDVRKKMLGVMEPAN
jgi:integrase